MAETLGTVIYDNKLLYQLENSIEKPFGNCIDFSDDERCAWIFLMRAVWLLILKMVFWILMMLITIKCMLRISIICLHSHYGVLKKTMTNRVQCSMNRLLNAVRAKLFLPWRTMYMAGKPGDYMAIRMDDLHDIYVIEHDIFKQTYEQT